MTTESGDIIATGANDVPCPGGGQYWGEDPEPCRDCERGHDSNQHERNHIITEYGRAVHAEMSALMSCARIGASTRGATIYCTTFPCHNCAKHIIAAGIARVVYIEPYPKSKALVLHDDAIGTRNGTLPDRKVLFEPFIGVAPRRFVDLFAMDLGNGESIPRKDRQSGRIVEFVRNGAKPRDCLVPYSHLELEEAAAVDLEIATGGTGHAREED